MSSSNRPPATTELRQKSVYSRNNQQSSSSGASLESMRASLEVALLYLSDAVARTLTAPFSRTKVVLQTQHLAIPASGLPYTNGVNALREQWLREGRHGFWKGNLAHILRGPLLSWSSSYTFLKLQSWLQPTGTTKPIHSRTLLAACLAGATTGALEYPLQHARNLLAADLSPKGSKPQYTGIWDALWQTGRGHGVLSLYRGLGIGMVGNGLQILVRLPVFDALARAGGVDGIGTGEPKAWMRLGVAVAATVVGHWVAYPLDTVRRLALLSNTPGFQNLYHGPLDAARQLLALHGIRGFYHGALFGAMRTGLAGAFQFQFYFVLFKFVGEIGLGRSN